jgi:hypothetical protein
MPSVAACVIHGSICNGRGNTLWQNVHCQCSAQRLFVPYASKDALLRKSLLDKTLSAHHSARSSDAAAGAGDTPHTSLARSVYSTKQYRLPDELDATFIRLLLLRIRTDLHAKGYLDSPHAQLTRCVHAWLPAAHLWALQAHRARPACAPTHA